MTGDGTLRSGWNSMYGQVNPKLLNHTKPKKQRLSP